MLTAPLSDWTRACDAEGRARTDEDLDRLNRVAEILRPELPAGFAFAFGDGGQVVVCSPCGCERPLSDYASLARALVDMGVA